nr:MAG TPA: hypothetical protein [Caudoviricetes sp.]
MEGVKEDSRTVILSGCSVAKLVRRVSRKRVDI